MYRCMYHIYIYIYICIGRERERERDRERERESEREIPHIYRCVYTRERERGSEGGPRHGRTRRPSRPVLLI